MNDAESGWRPIAIRSAICLVFTIIGWATSSPFAFVGAYLAGGWDLAQKVWEGIREREFGTDFLMFLVAVGAAAIGEPDEGAVLMFLFSASSAMERFAFGRTNREINALLKHAPKTARLIEGGAEREVPVAELKPGQIVRVTANEQVPVDILVQHGDSSCDESMLTGEAEPISKTAGDTALAGTLNLQGVFEGKVLRAAEDSALQRIIRLIDEAQHLKAPSQRFTDRFGTRYTVFVLTLCTVMFFVWWLGFHHAAFARNESAIYHAMTLLVVMSPCAIVLSVPSAILSAIAFGAKNGILFRGGAAIESLATVTAVAMDKTGTLTEGNLHVVGVEVVEGTEEEIMNAAGNIARLSNHPMSRSLAREAARRHIALEEPGNSETVAGQGVRAQWHGETVVLGNRELVATIRAGDLLLPQPRDASEVWVASGKMLGRILLRDRVRPESKDLIAQLHAAGISTTMLTGDKSGAAMEMGRETGVGEVLSQLKPDEKVAAVQRLKASGKIVAMIGDGVNDAPVLAAADVGIAMGARGSDAAIEQAEVVLMNDKLESFLTARCLSCRARTIIKQNMVIALGVIIGMSVTTILGVAVPLAVGVTAHEGSTVIVVLNSLRLLFGQKVCKCGPSH
jgi:Zn2+/Cd2+-exporting ATPase